MPLKLRRKRATGSVLHSRQGMRCLTLPWVQRPGSTRSLARKVKQDSLLRRHDFRIQQIVGDDEKEREVVEMAGTSGHELSRRTVEGQVGSVSS